MKVFEITKAQTGAEAHIGFGRGNRPFFWIGSGGHAKRGLHVAFTADTRAQVDAFYAEAIAAGGRDNGGLGIRPHSHADYHGAFVLDADGNTIEAVCHAPAN